MWRLFICFYVGLCIFACTLLVYGIGITFDLCTWSPQLVTIVGLNDLMVAAVLWMFWE
jgi:hypothetical protein